jgi:hypothetical protein
VCTIHFVPILPVLYSFRGWIVWLDVKRGGVNSMDIADAGQWAVMAIHLWNSDLELRREFENVSDFSDWTHEEAERLIRSATKIAGNKE